MADNFLKIYKGATFTPRSDNPSSPVEGDIYYSDGTVRDRGFWEYVNNQWQRLGGGQGGGGVGEMNLDGDVAIKLVPTIVRQLTLEDSNNIRWDVTIGVDGLLVTTSGSGRVPDAPFKLELPDSSFAQLKIDTDGVLLLEIPPSNLSIPTDNFYYIEDSSGLRWKLVADFDESDEPILVTSFYDNSFTIESEDVTHFIVRQTSARFALTYLQTYTEDFLPESPQIIPNMNPMAFKADNSGATYPIHWNGTNWQSSGGCVGDIQQSILTESQFQSLRGEDWVLMDGRNVEGSRYHTFTGEEDIPDARGTYLRSKDNGRGLDPNGDPNLGTYQEDQFQGHRHEIRERTGFGSGPNSVGTVASSTGGFANTLTRAATTLNDGAPRTGPETRPKSTIVNTFIKIN
jgi:hypothetical protein